MKRFLIAVTLSLIPVAVCAIPPTTAKIVRISDGDTATVNNGLTSEVRIACIDAAEVPHSRREEQTTDQVARTQYKWGKLAQARISSLLATAGSEVLIEPVSIDRYKRNIASVRFQDGSDWGHLLVSEGLAVVYREYTSAGCDKDALFKAEAQAKQQKLGVWSEDVMLPSEFRSR
jgi:endonuclease YncB( thermonuclease family)